MMVKITIENMDGSTHVAECQRESLEEAFADIIKNIDPFAVRAIYFGDRDGKPCVSLSQLDSVILKAVDYEFGTLAPGALISSVSKARIARNITNLAKGFAEGKTIKEEDVPNEEG